MDFQRNSIQRFAVDADGREWQWDDVEMVGLRTNATKARRAMNPGNRVLVCIVAGLASPRKPLRALRPLRLPVLPIG